MAVKQSIRALPLVKGEKAKRCYRNKKYAVSTHGRVWVDAGDQWKKLKTTRLISHGYLFANIEHIPVQVHTLVLETFRGPRPVDKVCRHLDGYHQNNHLKNLKWGTKSQNTRDAVKHGCHVTKTFYRALNLSRYDVREIRKQLIRLRPAVVAAKFHIGVNHIKLIAHYYRWRKFFKSNRAIGEAIYATPKDFRKSKFVVKGTKRPKMKLGGRPKKEAKDE